MHVKRAGLGDSGYVDCRIQVGGSLPLRPWDGPMGRRGSRRSPLGKLANADRRTVADYDMVQHVDAQRLAAFG